MTCRCLHCNSTPSGCCPRPALLPSPPRMGRGGFWTRGCSSCSPGHVVRKPATYPVRGPLETWARACMQRQELGSWEFGLRVTGLGLNPSSATNWHWDLRTVGERKEKGLTVKCYAKMKDRKNQYFSLANLQPQTATQASSHCLIVSSPSPGGLSQEGRFC